MLKPRKVSPPEPESADVLIEADRESLLAIDGQLFRATLDGLEIIAATNATFVALAPFEPLFAMDLSPKRAAEATALLDGLGRRAMVFAAADSLAFMPSESAAKEERAKLLAEIERYDVLFARWARAAFADFPVQLELVENLIKGHGVVDSLTDVEGFVAMFRKYWTSVGHLVPAITLELLDKAGAAASRLKSMLRDTASAKGSPKDIKARAYTAWRADFVKLAATATYLSALHPELGPLDLPALSPPRVKPKAQATPAVEGAVAPTAPLPATAEILVPPGTVPTTPQA